jgi:hypothetical protein
MDHPPDVIGTDERAPANAPRKLKGGEGLPGARPECQHRGHLPGGDESPPRTSVSGESDQVTEAVPMDLQQGRAGRPSPTVRRAPRRGPRDAPPCEEGPRRSGSAFAVLHPSNPREKSDERWGNSLNVAHNVDSPPRTRVAVEAQLRDEASFYRQDREISFQVPGSSQPSTLAP